MPQMNSDAFGVLHIKQHGDYKGENLSDNGGQRSALNTHFGEAEKPVYHYGIENYIRNSAGNLSNRGAHAVSACLKKLFKN